MAIPKFEDTSPLAVVPSFEETKPVGAVQPAPVESMPAPSFEETVAVGEQPQQQASPFAQQDSIGEQILGIPKAIGYGAKDAYYGMSVGLDLMQSEALGKLSQYTSGKYDDLVGRGADPEGFKAKLYRSISDWAAEGQQVEAGFADQTRDLRDAFRARNDDLAKGMVTDIAKGVGGMWDIIPSAMSGGLFSVVSSPTRFMDEGYEEAIASGQSHKEAVSTAATYLITASPLEIAADMFIFKGKGKATARGMMPFLKQVGKKMGINFLSEGTTETLQDGILNKLTGKKMFTPESLYTFVVSGFVGTIAGGGSAVLSQSQIQRRVDALEAAGLDRTDAERAVSLALDPKTQKEAAEFIKSKKADPAVIAQENINIDTEERPFEPKDVKRVESIATKENPTGEEIAELSVILGQLSEEDQKIVYDHIDKVEGSEDKFNSLMKRLKREDMEVQDDTKRTEKVGTEQGKVEGQQQERVPTAGKQQRAQEPGSAEEVLEGEDNLPPLYQRGDDPEFDRLMDNVKAADLLRPSRDDFDNDGEYELAFLQWQLAKAEARLAMGDYKTKKGEAGIDDQGRNPEQRRADRLSNIESLKEQIIEQEIDNAIETVEAPTQEAPKQAPIQEKVDTTGLDQAMREDKTEEIPPEPPPIPEDDTVGISKAWDAIENELPFDESVMTPERQSRASILKQAFKQGFHRKVDVIINKIKKNQSVSTLEYAGLLIRKTEVFNEIKNIRKQMVEADKNNDVNTLSRLADELDIAMNYGIELTEHIRTGRTETARALAFGAAKLDEKSYDLVDVIALAKATYGKNFTKETEQSLTEKVDELEALLAEIDDLANADYPTPNAMLNRLMILDEIERIYRRLKKKGRKKEDVNADVKLIRKRQDEIFKLIDEINNGRPKGKQIKKEKPDSYGFLEMIGLLREALQRKNETIRKVQQNIKLIDQRDALIAEVENMHRDIREKAEKLSKSKLEKDIALYKEARADQDTIAKLLGRLRGDTQQSNPVTKEDVFGYKQTIQNLLRQISNKKIIETVNKQIVALESAIAEGDFEFTGKDTDAKQQIDKGVAEVRKRKAEAQKKLLEMKRERDRLDRLESEKIEMLDGLEQLHRRIKTKKEKGIDPNEDIKLALSRQDKLFKIIDEINRGKPKNEKINKVRKPDTEGYLEMIEALKPELDKVRSERALDARIAELEADIESGNIDKYDIRKGKTEENIALLYKQARAKALKTEINRQIAAGKPRTLLGNIRYWVWDPLRNLKLSVDEGHILRQGAFFMSDWKNWMSGDVGRFVGTSFKLLFSEEYSNLVDAMIMSDKDYQKAKVGGVPFVEEGQQLDAREEILTEGVLTKIPVIGKWQKAFGRAQITGTNYLRLLTFKALLADNPNATVSQLKNMGKVTAVLTGRGATVRDPRIKAALDTVLTSASFTASRFQTPFLLAHRGADGRLLWNDKKLRNHVLKDYAFFMATRMGLMAAFAAALPDVEIGDDEDHWTYGRLIVYLPNGMARVYDPWAGIASTYRAIFPAGEGDFGGALDKLFEGRKHPALASIQEVGFGKTYYGADIDRKAAAFRAMLPISVDGVREAIKEDTGVFDLLVATATDIFGVGSTLVPSSSLP